jgi:hypothetical protein
MRSILLLASLAVSSVGHAADAGTLTVVVSKIGREQFCNGEQMDSDGYRKTLTAERPLLRSPATQRQQIAAVIAEATDGQCRQVLKQLDIRVIDGVAHIPPFDGGWAGVSIAMCSCVPDVEENLIRVPGIRNVVWDRPRR